VSSLKVFLIYFLGFSYDFKERIAGVYASRCKQAFFFIEDFADHTKTSQIGQVLSA
jgi:hypothetical protein